MVLRALLVCLGEGRGHFLTLERCAAHACDGVMTNDEGPNDEGMSKSEVRIVWPVPNRRRHSVFVIRHWEIRHSSAYSSSSCLANVCLVRMSSTMPNVLASSADM